jgi:Tfp pilus assembly protein PilX
MNVISDSVANDELVGTAIDINKTANNPISRPIDVQTWKNDSPYFNTSLAEKNTPFQSGTSVTNTTPQIYVIPLGTSSKEKKAFETDSTIKTNTTQENFDVMSIFNNKNFLTIVVIALIIFAFKKSS